MHLQYRTVQREAETAAKNLNDKINNKNQNKENEQKKVVAHKNSQSGTQANNVQRFKRSTNNVASAATAATKRQGGAPTMPMVSVQIKGMYINVRYYFSFSTPYISTIILKILKQI